LIPLTRAVVRVTAVVLNLLIAFFEINLWIQTRIHHRQSDVWSYVYLFGPLTALVALLWPNRFRVQK
jgi:hypothetical protein